METIRKITISIDPPKSLGLALSFLDLAKGTVESFLSNGKYANEIGDKTIEMQWYDDFPTSCGVALTVGFQVLRGVDLVGELIIALRKEGYEIRGVNVGY